MVRVHLVLSETALLPSIEDVIILYACQQRMRAPTLTSFGGCQHFVF